MSPYLSLPKNGSLSPAELVTQNHGAPKAPLSKASWVVLFSRTFISSDEVARMIRSTSSGLNRAVAVSDNDASPLNPDGTSASTLAKISGLEMLR